MDPGLVVDPCRDYARYLIKLLEVIKGKKDEQGLLSKAILKERRWHADHKIFQQDRGVYDGA